MKHKYYYNNQLIRTSENEYKYALLFKHEDGTYEAYRCSSSYDLCLKELNHKTKAETIAKATGATIKEVYYNKKYRLWSSQLYKREDFIIVELEQR